MVTVRVMTDDDWPLWRDVRIAALTESPDVFRARLADWESSGAARWRARLTMPGAHNVVAMLDGNPVGLTSGVPGAPGEVILHSVWVSPTARGRGVASLLIDAVRTWAKDTGATTLTLAVIPGNEAAVRLYRRLGFVDTDLPGELLPDGVTREHVMELKL